MHGPWLVYVLKSTCSRRTYVGVTNNFPRRLRQHNGDLSGGARYTSTGRPWVPLAIVDGFGEDHCHALQMEWALKHERRNNGKIGHALGNSVRGRVRNLRRVLALERVTKSAPVTLSTAVSLRFYDQAAELEYNK